MKINLLLALFLMYSGVLLADTITIKNRSDFDIYAAVYYFDKVADLKSDVKLLPAQKEVQFERPSFSLLGPSRYVAFSFNKGDLREQLTSSEFHLTGNTTVGTEQGSTFYITFDRGELRGFNILEWKVIEPLKKKVGWIIDMVDDLTLGQIRREYEDSPFAKIDAVVRQSKDIPEQERAYKAARLPKVKAVIEKLLNMKLADNEVPIIAFSASGGGYRAMLGAAGSASGAGDLIDAAFYFAGLSGGTWFLGPWEQSQLSAEAFAATIPAKIARDFVSVPSDIGQLIQYLLMRLAFKQPISPVNIYARLLAASILSGLKNGPFDIYLHDQANLIKGGDAIFPIYTAIATKLPYQWIEFTPYEMGGGLFWGLYSRVGLWFTFFKW